MSESPRDRANREQLAGSDPVVSAFVAASAGSGKTKLLTDRLLRLMLTGARPDRIQCLTFTKAAAAEMALRLQRTLGRWVTLSQPALTDELRRLNVEPTDTACRTARALFSHVLDLPGGMRIGTIHAFSQSVLRRFPLEAAISPHFQLVDDRDAQDALIEAREDMLAGASDPALRAALDTLAGLATADQFGRHVVSLQTDRRRLAAAVRLGPDLRAAQRRALGVSAASEMEIVSEAVQWMGEHALRQVVRNIQAEATPAVVTKSGRMLDWLALDPSDRAENWAEWQGEFFTKAGTVSSTRTLIGDRLATRHPDWLDQLLAEAARIDRIEESRRAIRVAAVSHALVVLAVPVVEGYALRKAESGLLDYEDLIGRTSSLLVDPGAAWVLYKLDGGLDHLLLDEVQDTAPEQWGIAHALTEEFFAGAGARDTVRTVFAVGDRKQSIYSFQGADTREFDHSRALLSRRVKNAVLAWRDVELDVSFRSTAPVLGLVDAVFANPGAAAGVVDAGQTLTHRADRADHAGMVELWPLAPLPEPNPVEPWEVADANHGLTSGPQLLADTLAEWISKETSGNVTLESKGRPLAPGDIMVLVRRRNAFARSLVRALKARGVAVAGLDRLVLTEQPAVQDLMALGDALLLPQDDLTFACVLTSPLGGLNDDDLMELAIGRRGSLSDALRDRAGERPTWQAVWDFFAPLLARVDFTSPYALFTEALGILGGRARLFSRLGPEAAEPLDEFLNAALVYGRSHPRSLQGFLHWLRRSGAEVKREAEAAGNQVRVMTVHGAKGLQAPLVILPDTTALPPDVGSILWADDPATGVTVPLWSPRREVRCKVIDDMRQAERRQDMEEHNRLLYVALTRAEDRLLVCGWQTKREPDATCWYRLVEKGFAAVEATAAFDSSIAPFDAWDGDIRVFGTPQLADADPGRALAASDLTPMPDWLGRAPDWRARALPAEPPMPRPLAPSRPEGVELGAVPAPASPLSERDPTSSRFRRGQLIHALLQHLPALPQAAWTDAASLYVSRPGHDLTAADQRALVREVLAILTHPELTALFGPNARAEVPLTGVVGSVVVGGLVDRLAVLDDQVLLADFKTNRQPPARTDDTPVLYLRQMATYRAVLRAIYPDRPVRCALIWTREARVSMLPDALLDSHEPSSAPA